MQRGSGCHALRGKPGERRVGVHISGFSPYFWSCRVAIVQVSGFLGCFVGWKSLFISTVALGGVASGGSVKRDPPYVRATQLRPATVSVGAASAAKRFPAGHAFCGMGFSRDCYGDALRVAHRRQADSYRVRRSAPPPQPVLCQLGVETGTGNPQAFGGQLAIAIRCCQGRQ